MGLLVCAAIISLNSFGQNEFAASVFYKEFQKIYNDAQSGFKEYRGAKRKVAMEELVDEFRIKKLLPLADSGKIVFPLNGRPYAEFYFQPGKSKAEINDRALNLREAVLTAFGKPLYSRSETIVNKKSTLNHSWFYTEPEHSDTRSAIFKSTISGSGRNYALSFRIFGKAD